MSDSAPIVDHGCTFCHSEICRCPRQLGFVWPNAHTAQPCGREGPQWERNPIQNGRRTASTDRLPAGRIRRCPTALPFAYQRTEILMGADRRQFPFDAIMGDIAARSQPRVLPDMKNAALSWSVVRWLYRQRPQRRGMGRCLRYRWGRFDRGFRSLERRNDSGAICGYLEGESTVGVLSGCTSNSFSLVNRSSVKLGGVCPTPEGPVAESSLPKRNPHFV